MANVILRSNLTRVVSYFINEEHSVDIVPGINQVASHDFSNLSGHNDHFKERLNKFEFSIVTEQGKTPKSLDELSAAAARELINETRNTTVLRQWLATATRSTVLNAIKERLQTIDKKRTEKGHDKS